MIYLLLLLILPLLLIYYYYSYRSRIKCHTIEAIKCLYGKNVFITGASSGLGKEIAKIFYQHGSHVILASRRLDELNKVRQEFLSLLYQKIEPDIVKLDLNSLDETEIVAKNICNKYDIDILVNNAGISCRNNAIDTINDVDQRLFMVNFFSNIALTKIMLKSMINKSTKQNAKIMVISSIQDRIATPFRSSYSSSKHALRSWYDSLRSELSLIEKSIQISLISPGYIRTNISMNAINSDGTNYGRMDQTTANGYEPKFVAEKCIEALLNNDDELILAPFIHRIVIIIRTLFPKLYFFIMKIYAKYKPLTKEN